jgi:hypothetical protein
VMMETEILSRHAKDKRENDMAAQSEFGMIVSIFAPYRRRSATQSRSFLEQEEEEAHRHCPPIAASALVCRSISFTVRFR